jgi:hypothetical protein
MNWKSPAMIAGLVSALCLSATTVARAQEGHGEPEMSAEAQAEMAAWMKLAQPGEHHQHLQMYEGKWKTQIKMWMSPGAEPMLNESTAESEWIMDGRFLRWHQKGDFAGSPYTGLGYDGYNNGDSRYESMYMDNFGTLMILYTGECSDDGKTRVMHGSFTNPMAGATIEQRNVYNWIDDDHFKLESFMKMGDEEYKQMEMLYERQ